MFSSRDRGLHGLAGIFCRTLQAAEIIHMVNLSSVGGELPSAPKQHPPVCPVCTI
jgi:hypothetical protein